MSDEVYKFVEIDAAEDRRIGLLQERIPYRIKYVSVSFPPPDDPFRRGTYTFDQLDAKIGGVKLRDLLKIDEERRREGHPNYRTAWKRLSDEQRAAVSAHWSAELRKKLDAARQADRNQVTVENNE